MKHLKYLLLGIALIASSLPTIGASSLHVCPQQATAEHCQSKEEEPKATAYVVAFYACYSRMPRVADLAMMEEYLAIYDLERQQRDRLNASGSKFTHTVHYDPCASLHNKLIARWRELNDTRNLTQEQERCAQIIAEYLKEPVERPKYIVRLEHKFKGDATAIADYIFQHSMFTNKKVLKRFLKTPSESKILHDVGYQLMASMAEFEDNIPEEDLQAAQPLLAEGTDALLSAGQAEGLAGVLPRARKPKGVDLATLIRRAYTFDDRFPRETVYLHTDNASYIQGDTLWYKAFVVRASTLRPDSTLSRTLYVELLNDAGTLLQRSVLRLDSIGQAHGNFALTPPLQNGFYEIRAYTRAMTNWGPTPNPSLRGRGEVTSSINGSAEDVVSTPRPRREGLGGGSAGYFSRVFPLFELPKKALPGDFTQLDIQRPESEIDFKMPHERPYDFGSAKERRLEFFPEGGQLAAATRAHVAYRLTDGRGMPVQDSIAVFSAQGELLCKSVPEYEGMGSFVLPKATALMYAKIVGKAHKYPLPELDAYAVSLHVYETASEETKAPVVNIDLEPAAQLGVSNSNPLKVAVIAFHRETPYKVYPIELLEGITTLVIDREDLKPGVNRLEVVDAEGLPLASRFVYSPATQAGPQVTVRQNAESYEAFEPIAIELELKDEDGQPIPFTELSVSVRDERGDLVLDTQPSLSTQLNFCSELQGYVPPSFLHAVETMQNPSETEHFSSPRSGGKRGVDLLMQIQGWCPETMAQLCQLDSFVLRQPMEDNPIIRGRVIKDNDRLQPFADTPLSMVMYNLQGHVMKAQTTTDKDGVFAFESHGDFVGDFTTQFNVKNEKNIPVWHRVMLDQWYGPKPKKYSPYEMQTLPPPLPKGRGEVTTANHESSSDVVSTPLPRREGQGVGPEGPLLFQWTDTIPRAVNRNLREAVVKKKKSFVFELIGQEFDRYNYGGGEAHSIRHSDTYFNVDLELQRIRDLGVDVFYINDFVSYLIGDKDKTLNPDPIIHGTTPADLVTHANINTSLAEPLSGAKDERGLITPDKVNGSYDLDRFMNDENTMGVSNDGETMKVKGMTFYVIVNNHAGIPESQSNMQTPEQLKSVIVSYDAKWANSIWHQYHPNSTKHMDGVIYLHTRPDWYKFKNVKGVQKRTLHGYTLPDEFKGPDYRRLHQEDDNDYRRTLYWNPCLTTDANGKATAIFYANARWHQNLRITVRGITADGRIIEYDR